eukprot:scaffold122884_cov28-Tisochrysis_lutea.AAC.4
MPIRTIKLPPYPDRMGAGERGWLPIANAPTDGGRTGSSPGVTRGCEFRLSGGRHGVETGTACSLP